MILSKFLVAFIQLAVLVVAALQAALIDGLTEVEVYQLAGLLVGGIVTYFAPLLQNGWAAALKVIGAVLGAVIAAIIPLLAGEWTASSVLIVVLAGLNTLAVQIGVDVRVQSAVKAIVKEGPVVAATLDTAAIAVAHRQLPPTAQEELNLATRQIQLAGER